MKQVAGFMRKMVLGNLPYLKRSDRIGLIVNLSALALLLAVAALSRRHG